ncbi:uncharacterized protein KY384_009191 [Bacidia gigantensis]|uniref:uncharacterized protein n=1 Tax=Bacidia gigantensis TaxID=2732470 RepID=UPI001D042B61|nr:uncharacterized protein KY384_009191 [Bacidia gigantensis]KAG8525547.1 hypothetical protein KY384_009191 [Bacidia gigantensis]
MANALHGNEADNLAISIHGSHIIIPGYYTMSLPTRALPSINYILETINSLRDAQTAYNRDSIHPPQTTTSVLAAIVHQGQAARIFDPRTYNTPIDQDLTFDYVVVGGGTASLALAARLVEGFSHSVAVIEAGGFYEQDNGNLSVVPAYCPFFAGTDPDDFNPLVDWGFVTEPQKGAEDRRIHYPRGKTLGGSSARNFMYHHRPTVGALNKWAEEVGDESYAFDNLFPFFQKSVHYTPGTVPFTNSTNTQDPNAWSPAGGPVQVSHGKYVEPFGTWVQPAMERLGMKAIDGFQSGRLIGSSYGTFTVDPQSAHRSSSETSYLASVRDKKNLKVYHNTLAEKVLLDKTQTATGVLVSAKNNTFTLNAKKEVILSAGAFQSPQLLMLSGIGPREQLESLNIPVSIDLPGVGQNLADHPLFGSEFRVNVPTISASLNSPALMVAAQEAYNNHAAGPLTIPTTGFIGWEKIPSHLRQSMTAESRKALDEAFPADWPELEFLPANAALGLQRNYMTEDPVDGHNYAWLGTSMVAPLSRGSVSLNSSHASDLPKIDPNFFGHKADQEVAIAAIRRQREIWQAMPGVTVGEEYLLGPKTQSDEEILAFVKKAVAPTWHASGTCKMGKKEDKEAVVDSGAKVFGTRGLRVVDASAFPFLLPGHPQSAVYALAEKIAADILRGEVIEGS